MGVKLDLGFMCRRTFGMEPHQVRHLLQTFRSGTVQEAFLLAPTQVTEWCRRLGVVPRRGPPSAYQRAVNGAAMTGRYFG